MVPQSGLAAVLAVVASAFAAAPALAATDSSAAQPPTITSEWVAFSPNGDGVKDRARIHYTLPEASGVSVAVFGRDGKEFRTVLGKQSAGTHTWIWDGRTPGGRRLPHSTVYAVEVRSSDGRARVDVSLDLRFQAKVDVLQRFGRRRSETPHVFPRTNVVRDSIGLMAYAHEREFRRAVLQVRDPDGRVVLRRDLVEHPTGFVEDGFWQNDPEVWEARDSGDRPLPSGLYSAVVQGVDRVGNAGTSRPLRIRVSRHRLDWVDETRSITPADVDHPTACGAWFDSNGCPDSIPCGPVVPSALFTGGLSHRAAPCTDYRAGFGPPRAESVNWFGVPEAVRGIAALRVAFTGAPTNAGETDTGTLRVWGAAAVEVTSATGASSGWVDKPYGGDGKPFDPMYYTPRMPPSAMWRFETTGTDSFDVASYTVDLRYLGVG